MIHADGGKVKRFGPIGLFGMVELSDGEYVLASDAALLEQQVVSALAVLEKWHRWATSHSRKATLARSVLDETSTVLAARSLVEPQAGVVGAAKMPSVQEYNLLKHRAEHAEQRVRLATAIIHDLISGHDEFWAETIHGENALRQARQWLAEESKP